MHESPAFHSESQSALPGSASVVREWAVPVISKRQMCRQNPRDRGDLCSADRMSMQAVSLRDWQADVLADRSDVELLKSGGDPL